MNQEEAGEILRANVKNLSEPLKSAVEFALTNFFAPSAADLAKKFLASLPSMTTEDAELKSRIDSAYFTIMNDKNVWLSLENLPHEEWRDVRDYKGLYKVSNLGRLKSISYGNEKIRKPVLCKPGYFSLVLYKDNFPQSARIHVLVAQAFIPNPENKAYVNHKDGNKLNNRLENLEWLTPSENLRHALDTGLKKRGHEHSRAKLTAEQVRYIRRICIPGDREFGFGALARKFGVCIATISEIYHGKTYKNVT